MAKILVKRNCRAGGAKNGISLAAGKQYEIGKDVSEEDAEILVRLGRAENVEAKGGKKDAE